MTGSFMQGYKPKPLERPDWLMRPLDQTTRDSPKYHRLLRMLNYKRPADSTAEKLFIERYIDSVEGMESDAYGNRYVNILTGDNTDSIVMWSSHTDTVHSSSGKQKLRVTNDYVGVADKLQSNCLGADDTAGVWLMLEMIEANIPGLYVFHRAEEVGGLGSRFISETTPELLEGIKCAIAFDRKGYNSIITSQFGSKCCSDDFAMSLGDMLILPLFEDPSGTFTDTANYTHLVPECTNISVGYDGAHTSSERLDLRFLFILRDSILRNWDERCLTISRTPVRDDWFDDWDSFGYPSIKGGYKSNNKKVSEAWKPTVIQGSKHKFEDMIKLYPDVTAHLLEEYGLTSEDLEEYIFKQTGKLPFLN